MLTKGSSQELTPQNVKSTENWRAQEWMELDTGELVSSLCEKP